MRLYSNGFRAALLGSTMALTPVLISAAAAQSQTSATAADAAASTSGDVVVTALRQGTPVDRKRGAQGVVDGIGAAEIRRLPSTTIATALTHIAGVSVTPNNDNERGRNFAQDPAIRGLDSKYNNVMIDGLPIATVNFTGTGVSSRATALDTLPSAMVSTIEVYKTYSPDRDPEAIGGGIELTTRGAYDNGGAPYFELAAKGGYNSLNSQPLPQNAFNDHIDLTFSRVFGADHQFGLVISGTYERGADDTYDNATTDNTYYNFYNSAGKQVATPALSNGFAVPQQSKSWIIEEVDKKEDLTAKLEYHPTNKIDTYLTVGYYSDEDDSTRNENILTPGGVLTNQTATSGTFSQGDVEVGGQYSPLKRIIYGGQFGTDVHLTDQDLVSLRASDSYATWRQPEYMVKFINQTASSPTGGSSPVTVPANGFNYTLYSKYSNFNMNPAVFDNINNYEGDYWRYRNRQITTGNDAFKLDYDHNAGSDALGFGVKVGVDVRQTRNWLKYFTPDYEPNTIGAVTLAVAPQFSSFKIPNYSSLPFMLINVGQAFTFLKNNPSLFHSTNQNANNNINNFNLREDTADGYGMLVYNAPKLHAMIGVRDDSADVDVTGNQQLPNPKGVVSSGLAGTPYPAFQPIRIKSNYSNPLPAASVSYLPITTLELRAAVSRTIGRPDYSDYSPSSGISQDPNTGIVTITQGNPNLKPRLSTNYDLAAEWYFLPQSLLSAAVFHKDISNEIFSITTNGTTVFNGVTEPTVTTEPVNAAKSTLNGVELEWVQQNYGRFAHWLEGFGTDLNYTALQGSAIVPATTGATRKIASLINQPQYVGNAIFTYDRGPFTGAVSYNFTGRSLRALVANAPWQDVYWTPRQQLDLKLGYAVRHDLELTASVQNLTNETTESVTGPGRNLLKDNSFVGQTLWFGVVFRPGF